MIQAAQQIRDRDLLLQLQRRNFTSWLIRRSRLARLRCHPAGADYQKHSACDQSNWIDSERFLHISSREQIFFPFLSCQETGSSIAKAEVRRLELRLLPCHWPARRRKSD